jgi:hypothetical protein
MPHLRYGNQENDYVLKDIDGGITPSCCVVVHTFAFQLFPPNELDWTTLEYSDEAEGNCARSTKCHGDVADDSE